MSDHQRHGADGRADDEDVMPAAPPSTQQQFSAEHEPSSLGAFASVENSSNNLPLCPAATIIPSGEQQHGHGKVLSSSKEEEDALPAPPSTQQQFTDHEEGMPAAPPSTQQQFRMDHEPASLGAFGVDSSSRLPQTLSLANTTIPHSSLPPRQRTDEEALPAAPPSTQQQFQMDEREMEGTIEEGMPAAPPSTQQQFRMDHEPASLGAFGVDSSSRLPQTLSPANTTIPHSSLPQQQRTDEEALPAAPPSTQQQFALDGPLDPLLTTQGVKEENDRESIPAAPPTTQQQFSMDHEPASLGAFGVDSSSRLPQTLSPANTTIPHSSLPPRQRTDEEALPAAPPSTQQQFQMEERETDGTVEESMPAAPPSTQQQFALDGPFDPLPTTQGVKEENDHESMPAAPPTTQQQFSMDHEPASLGAFGVDSSSRLPLPLSPANTAIHQSSVPPQQRTDEEALPAAPPSTQQQFQMEERETDGTVEEGMPAAPPSTQQQFSMDHEPASLGAFAADANSNQHLDTPSQHLASSSGAPAQQRTTSAQGDNELPPAPSTTQQQFAPEEGELDVDDLDVDDEEVEELDLDVEEENDGGTSDASDVDLDAELDGEDEGDEEVDLDVEFDEGAKDTQAQQGGDEKPLELLNDSLVLDSNSASANVLLDAEELSLTV